MFERFTEQARQVVVLAQEEARSPALKHNYIGTEHLLLGLLREQQGLAAHVLESLGITAERVREQLIRIVGAGEELAAGQIPFTPRAKKVLELALREMLSSGADDIGTEHVLLGLLHVNESVAFRILVDSGADPERIRQAVTTRLSVSGTRRRPEAPIESGPDETSAAPTGQVVLQIELSITPPATGVEQLNQAALAAVQRVLENAGAQLHWAGVRVIDPDPPPRP